MNQIPTNLDMNIVTKILLMFEIIIKEIKIMDAQIIGLLSKYKYANLHFHCSTKLFKMVVDLKCEEQ